MTLENKSGITYYRQIADVVTARIYNGFYKQGERIPSSRKLSEEFGCNRHTIRRALDLVETNDLIVRQQGRGTFVASELPKKEPKTMLNLGLIDISHALGSRPPAQVLQATVQPAGEMAPKVNIHATENVTYIHRLRLIDNSPSIIEYIYIPADMTPDLIKYDLSQSLRQLMQAKFNLEILRHEVIVEPTISTAYVSQLLNIQIGSPVMLEKRITYTTANTISEYSEHIYRGDRFSFVLK